MSWCMDAQKWPYNTPQERHRALLWAQRLKHAFNIDICEHGSAYVKVITSIDHPREEKIMTYRKQQEIKAKQVQPINMLPASLQINLFD